VNDNRTKRCCVPLLILLSLTGCSTFDFDFKDEQFALGRASREQVEQHFGGSGMIDTASVGDVSATRYAYKFKDTPQDLPAQIHGAWQAPRKELVVEFVNDTLNGYLYNNSVDQSSTNFRHHLRGKILIGRAKKAMVDSLLGEPAGKVLLPTTILGQKLLDHLTHVLPTNAHEGWCYYYDYFYYRAGQRKRFEYYKFLVVYFDSSGVVIDKFYRESDKTEPKTTSVFTN